MNYSHFIGFDISKLTLDVSVLDQKGTQVFYAQIKNTRSDLAKLDKELTKKSIRIQTSLLCGEHTGVYGNHLRNWSEQRGFTLWLEQPLQIKRSQGIQRGKNDKIDAYRIAMYGFKNKTSYKPTIKQRDNVLLLKELLSHRRRLMKAKMQISQLLTERSFYEKEVLKAVKANMTHSLKGINLDLKETEKAIRKLLQEDAEFKRLYTIMNSVDGIGLISAAIILVASNEFKSIKDGKQFSCYAGFVPFEYNSGTSVRSKPRVSQMANKKVKTVLHMAAMSVIKIPGDLREYYLRKVGEGKNKMSVINAVRNKLILRVFACVKENRLFEKKFEYSLV